MIGLRGAGPGPGRIRAAAGAADRRADQHQPEDRRPRIADPVIRQMCILDQDDFFLKSVQEGKTRVGVVHMPAWKDVLSPAAIWTIRTFLESRSR